MYIQILLAINLPLSFIRKNKNYQLNQIGIIEDQMTLTLQNLDANLSSLSNMIDISFKDILYQVQAQQEDGEKFTKTILHGVTGIFKAGELNVIMGASGAGKTTLLNILAGRITEFKGEILANGTPYDFKLFGGFANYVMQGDVLMETLTVKETLMFAANLKLKNANEVEQRVQTIIRQMKLQKCKDVLVGGSIIKGISGGQKKRTSIAVELISDPQVVALDEPTSGMDSLTSFIIINQLKHLAKQGKTIFLTIHQPNSQIFALFDTLILMVEGRIIYQGRSDDSLNYFADNFGLLCPEFQNPADYYMSIMHHQDARNVERYQKYFEVYKTKVSKEIQSRIERVQRTPVQARISQTQFFHNVKHLLKRDLLNVIRNPIIMQSRVFQVIFMAIYSGGLYFNVGRQDYNDVISWYAISGYLFFVTMDLFMQALMPVALTFPMERLVFLKEQNSKMYTLGQYFISRNVIEIPYIIVIPLFFILINYWMIGLANTAQQFFTMYLIILIMSFTATSLGMLIGSVNNDPKNVSNMSTLFFIPLLAFSGFFKNYNSLPKWIGWIRFISPFNYNFTSLVGNQTLYKRGRVDELNLEVSMWIAILILFCLGIGFRIISFLLLKFKKAKLQ